MDLQIEASDASRNEVEVGGGVSEEKLGKQLQAVDVGNQECGDAKETLKDSEVSDSARQSERPTMGSGESKCEAQANGEALANGVREEGASGGDPSGASSSSRDFSVVPHTQEQEVSQNENDEEETNIKVTELINEILNQSSYLEDSNLNGLEFADTLPGEMDATDLNIAVKSSSHVLYLNHREENGSSPDSDSNMTTASEGSSTPTSELSSTSIHSSDQQNFLNTQDARVLTHLICSNNLADPDCRIEDKLSNECNPKLLLEVSVPDCINDLDTLSVKETILESNDSSILVMELIGEAAVPQTSKEKASLKGEPDADAIDCVNFDEGKVNPDVNISQETSTQSDQYHSIVVNSSETEMANTQQKGQVEELEPVGDVDKREVTEDVKISDITVKAEIQTFAEITDLSEITEIFENQTCTQITNSENKEAEAVDDTDFVDVISTETRAKGVNVAGAEMETESERNQEEINEMDPPEVSDSVNLEVIGDQVSTSTSAIISDEGNDVESEKESMEMAVECHDRELGEERKEGDLLNETDNQMTMEHITVEPENDVEKSDITEAVTALETLSLSVEPEKSIQRIESQSAESSDSENTNVMKQNDTVNNECDVKVLCEVDKSHEAHESAELTREIKPVITSDKKGKEENIASEYDCACRRNETTEEGGNVMVGVWAELRSSLRQLHRSMIPQSSQVLIQRSRPSINRIKALANMLVNHDAHQLYLRISHLAHELCIELKVRLLATIHDSPTPKEATAFIQGICDSYQWVMSVCEALHPALERLDSEHLSRFKLNWVTVNMHVFHSTILTDPDVHDYAQICKEKLRETPGGEDVLSCLASLHRTLAVAEAVWVRADTLLQEYAIERAALSARRRQLLADWEQFKAQQRTQQQEAAKAGVPNLVSTSAALSEDGGAQCPCDDCVNGRTGQLEGQPLSSNARIALSTPDVRSPSSCECHFCNASMAAATNEEPVLPPSSGSSLPPLAQPQLSLYPHIHNTPPGSDIVGTGQSREELGPIPPAPSTKPPITTNPYLGSDLLTEQLMREWELVYGDALTPPGSHPILPPPPDAVIQHYEGDPSSLVSGVETMRISSSRPSYTRAMVDPSMPYVPDSCTTARAHTTILPSSQPSAYAADHTVSSAHSVAKVPVSSRSSTPSCEGNVSAIIPDAITASGKSCCTTSNTTSVITHTHAHHTHTTATAQKGKCLGKVEEIRKRQLDRADTSTSRESVGESETSGGDEWSSGDETDSSTTVSSTHQDPHCDCCYCHMLHHKQGGGRQKYSDRRERLLKILSRKKNARNNAVCPNTTAANAVTAASDTTEVPTSTGGTPLGGQNIDKIMDYIEGNQTDEAKRAKKAAKKARQRQKKLALKKEKKEEEKLKLENKKGECEEEEEEEVEDGPLAELRRRAPDVTITVVRPGQQTSRTTSSPQMAFQRPRDPSPPAMEVYKPPQAKLVPSLAQSSEELSSQSQSSSRTILHPSRHSTQGRQPQSQPGKHFAASAPSFSNRESAERAMAGGGEPGGLSNILKAMDTSGKEKDKGSQMVTIRRVMDPNSAEPTVTITLKGEQPEKDKVLFKLINGQAVAGNGGSGQGGKKGSKSQKNSKPQAQPHSKAQPKVQPQPQPFEPIVPEGLDPEELRKLKKRQKKERQRLKRQQEQMQEQEKGQLQQLEIQKQQEFLRQQQEQIHQQQLALQRQQEQLIKQQQQQQQTQNSNSKKNKKKNKGGKNVTNSNKNNNKNGGNKGNSNGVSALVYDGDNMAQSFNLPPGVTINKVAGQPGMVTISNNMGGAFSQPFLPNPNIYPSPVVQGFPMSVAKNSQLPNSYNSAHTPSLSWNSAIDKAGSYPDKDNVIVVDTNNSFLGANSSPNSKTADPEVSSEEKIMMAIKGLIEPSSLTASQRKKYKKMKKAIQEEEEEERQKQKEEDDLMDQMYNLASGNWTRINEDKTNHSQGKNQSKKNQKQKENNKKQASQTANNKQNAQQSAKNNKQQMAQESHQQKQKQNSKNNTKQSNKDNTLQNITNQPKKESVSSAREKGKQQSHHQEENRQSSQQKQGQKKVTENQQKKTQQQKQAQQQKQDKQTHHQQNQSQHQKQQQKHDQKHQQQQKGKQEKHGMSSNQKVDPNSIGNYPNRIGYDPQDIAHEARYAQYLAANANTLAKMNYSTYNGSITGEQGQDQYLITEEEKLITKKKMKKKGKKGHLEDMTIDSVFTPKDVAEGELDETERDVEAFKRFCFNNVPRHSGEKPKVNFNVKDIMIKKRPCNGNL
ncbi:uncharacterized protein LOC134767543 [Penaeus indicus]|uniref:uncharacterized protein LOC134767543 n=1 Tax=Penaeus indicus TaxID=29960 RepID=UPI00300D52E2